MNNLYNLLSTANPIDIKEGLQAYRRYHVLMRDIANYYRYPLEDVVAAFVALSPNNSYKQNVRSLISVIDGHKKGKPLELIKTTTYNHCRDRAYKYIQGNDFLSSVKGLKTKAFYKCILEPCKVNDAVIDGHLLNAYRNELKPLKGTHISKKLYREIESICQELALKFYLLPNQVQAILWFAWKRKNTILLPSTQLHLWIDRTGDFWQTSLDLSDLQPYE